LGGIRRGIDHICDRSLGVFDSGRILLIEVVQRATSTIKYRLLYVKSCIHIFRYCRDSVHVCVARQGDRYRLHVPLRSKNVLIKKGPDPFHPMTKTENPRHLAAPMMSILVEKIQRAAVGYEPGTHPHNAWPMTRRSHQE